MSLIISDGIVVKILNKDAIIAGVGHELHLYTSGEKVENLTLPFKLHGKVHGIDVGEGDNADKLLVYGEKEFMILEWNFCWKFNLRFRGYLSDWISSARFLLESYQFICHSAHSIALRLQFNPCNKTCRVLEKSSCSDKSTLYCSLIEGRKWSELILFGGNAFGELLIWQPVCEKAPLLQRISSHNGVIFSIDYNSIENVLTTTSDDRSIKFWKVEIPMPSDWSKAKLIPLASGYGHIARVFQGKIIKYSNQLYAITVGEDSYICFWHINGKLIHKHRQQFGATIWNCDYDEETKTLYTVGSTGNVIAYGLQNVLKDAKSTPNKKAEIIIPAIDIQNGKEEFLAKIKFLSHSNLIGITNKNRMFHLDIESTNEIKWQIVDNFSGYKCTVLEVFKDIIAVCGYKRLTMFKFKKNNSGFERIYDDEILEGVIRSFKFFSASKCLLCDEGGKCILLNIPSTSEKLDNIKKCNILLPKCKESWSTTSLLIDDFLVISTRQGNILLFQWQELSNQFEQTDSLKHVHGNLGATLLKLVENTIEFALFKSAGHDSTLKLIRINKMESKLMLVNREVVSITWIEALKKIDGIEFLLGFNDNHFSVWTKYNDFALQVPCGGGHRCWDFWIGKDKDGIECINLVFIKNKQVLFHKMELFNKPNTAINLPARNMWHVKACNALQCIEKNLSEIVISGGDDNLIKISQLTQCKQELKQMAEIHTHISNIRALKILKIDTNMYLICSGGGRAQLCITQLNAKTFLVEEMVNFTIKSQNKPKDNTLSNSKNYSFDPETRIMSLDVLPLNCNNYHIFIGCSDGFIRKYKLNSNWEMYLLMETFYGKCILNVKLVDNNNLLVAATDGIIRFSNLDLTSVFLNLPHHASGINALDVLLNESQNELLVLTGGDDQDIVLTRLSFNGVLKTTPHIIETLRFDNLHTAQVTAVALSPCGRYFYSSSVDQLVFKLNLVTREIVEELITCIADVKGLHLCKNEKVLIYGCGLQMCGFKS